MKLYLKLYCLLFFVIVTATTFQGCKKFVEVDPPLDRLTDANVFNSDKTSIAVMTDTYARMSTENFSMGGTNLSGIPVLTGLSSDELILHDAGNTNLNFFFKNDLRSDAGSTPWGSIYNVISRANAVIEGVIKSTLLNPKVKQQLLGEATLIRAYCYFNLVNLYGEVPIVTTTNYEVIRMLGRDSKAAVYDQIVKDLLIAQSSLNDDYLDGGLLSVTSDRVRPTKACATALLARAYLYMDKFAEAQTQATTVIQNPKYGIVPTNEIFLKNSKETIWSLQPVGLTNGGANAGEAKFYGLTSAGPNFANPVYLNKRIIDALESEPLDNRRILWIGKVTTNGVDYYFSRKYIALPTNNSSTEFSILLRLSEQYLIRSEARARLGDVSGCQADLNVIRNRAGLANTTANTTSTLINAIMKERQVELFTEGGHRWFDLKRSGLLDNVMQIVTPMKNNGIWHSYQALYPLPLTDIIRAPNLKGKQNPGYTE